MSEVRPAIRRAARDSRACAHVWTEPGGGPQQARKETGRWRCVDYTDGAEFDHVRVEPGKAGAKKDVYWDPPPKASGKKPSAFLYPAMRHQGADTVIIAEGEKAADALADHLLGCKVIVLGTCSGSVAPTKAAIAAFQKHVKLDDMQLVFWPDADEPGRKVARTMARVHGAGIVDPALIPGAPDPLPVGWDAADWTPPADGSKLIAVLGARAPLPDEAPAEAATAVPSSSGFPANVDAALGALTAGGLGAVAARLGELVEAVAAAGLTGT